MIRGCPMSDMIYDRIKENLLNLKMTNTLETMDNYLEQAIKDKKGLLEVLDHIFANEASSKRMKSANTRIQMAGFPFRKTLEDFDFEFQPSIDNDQIMDLATMRFVHNQENVVFLGPPGVGKTHLAVALGMSAATNGFKTYYISCHKLIEQLNEAHYENRLSEKLKILSRYTVLIIDEIGYLPMDIQGANLFFQLIAKRYEHNTTIFTSNKPFSQWNDVFSDTTIAAAILDRILHHCNVVNIKGESYRLKERKEHMKATQKVNTLFMDND